MTDEIRINAPSGDPQALFQLADQLDGHAGAVGDLGANMLRTTGAIKSSANWTGTAANAYDTFTTDTAKGVSGFESPLKRVANAIRTYAGTLQSAQQRVVNAVNTANNAVKANDPNARAHIAAAEQTAGEAHADVTKAGDQAANDIEGDKSAFDDFMEKLEPVKTANEWAHVPTDLVASDLYLDKLLDKWKEAAEKGVNSAKETQSELDQTLQDAFDQDVGGVAHDFDNGLASMEDVESAFSKYDQMAKAASTAASGAVDSAETGLTVAKAAGAASKALGGLAIVGDALTIVKPEDSGTMGTVDRVAAGLNAAGTATALIAANASLDWIPGVGEAVAAGTGVYLAGDFLYHNVTGIRNFCNGVGSGIAAGAHAVGSGISSAAHTVTSWF